MVNNIIKVLLLVVIVVLGYFVVESVLKPVRFIKQVKVRENAVVQNLKDIRMAQLEFKSLHGNYTASFDTLIAFVKGERIPVVRIVPVLGDTTGLLKIRDTIGYIPVIDSLFGQRANYDIENLRYIPFSDNVPFELDASVIDKGGVDVNVFEASALYSIYLKGLEGQAVRNLIASKEQIDKFPGLKVGSMVDASTDGNWE
jgi:hypothetical protein